jgi:5-oxoprolinase (ATP-hydrolysing)
MRTVFIHRFAGKCFHRAILSESGILSAYGLGLADVVNEQQEPAALHYSADSLKIVNKRFEELCANATKDLNAQGFSEKDIEFEIYLNLRYDGTDTAIMTLRPQDENYEQAFVTQYKREYGFVIEVWLYICLVTIKGTPNHYR